MSGDFATRRDVWQQQMRNAATNTVLDQLEAELTYARTLAERVALVREYGERVA